MPNMVYIDSYAIIFIISYILDSYLHRCMNMAERDDYYLSINVIGDHGVGKTQIINRYLYDTFESSYVDHRFGGKIIYYVE